MSDTDLVYSLASVDTEIHKGQLKVNRCTSSYAEGLPSFDTNEKVAVSDANRVYSLATNSYRYNSPTAS